MGIEIIGGGGLNLGPRRGGLRYLSGGGDPIVALPFADEFGTAGALASPWIGGTHWVATAGVVANTPTPGDDAIVNGGFSEDSGWSKGVNWSIGSNVAHGNGAVGTDLAANPAPLTVGIFYQVDYDQSGRTAGSTAPIIGTNALASLSSASASRTGSQQANTTGFAMRGLSGFVGDVDNVRARALALSDLMKLINTSVADVTVSAKLVVASTDLYLSGLALNWDSATNPQNGVIVDFDRDTLRLKKCVAGTWTVVTTAAVTYGAAYVTEIRKSGDQYSVYYNAVQVIAAQTIADAGIINNKRHGIFSTDSRATIDSFTCAPT